MCVPFLDEAVDAVDESRERGMICKWCRLESGRANCIDFLFDSGKGETSNKEDSVIPALVCVVSDCRHCIGRESFRVLGVRV